MTRTKPKPAKKPKAAGKKPRLRLAATADGGNPFDAPAGSPGQEHDPNAIPSVPTWKRLIYFRSERIKSKLEESNLVKERKRLEEEITELGTKNTSARLQKCGEHYDVEKAIEKARINLRWFADQADTVIGDAMQGKMIEDEARPKPPSEIYEKKKPGKKKPSGEEKADPQLQIGESEKPEGEGE